MNQPLPRRVFLMTLAAYGLAFATGAQAQSLLDEKGAQVVALGCVADVQRVDVKKYTQFDNSHNCINCTLYQGKPTKKAASWCGLVHHLDEENVKTLIDREVSR